MLIDTHAHVADAQFDADRDAVFERAQAQGVRLIVEIAESPDGWATAMALADRYPFIYVSLGIHPHHAHLYGPNEWPGLAQRLREYAKHPKMVAIGEFGLDYFRMQNTREQQLYLYQAQLDLAKELGKPVVIHCREADPPKVGDAPKAAGEGAHADIQALLKNYFPANFLSNECPEPSGVVHCFSGTWADAQTYFQHGFMLGVDGPVTYPSAKLLQQNVTRMPVQRLVLETDAPYLPPQSHRGQRNEPSYVAAVASHIATLKHKTPEQLAEQTTANARALFRLPS